MPIGILPKIGEMLDDALQDDKKDLILAQGVLVMKEASEPSLDLSKPLLSSDLHDPDVMWVLLGPNGRTTERNLNSVVSNNTFNHGLRASKTLVDFDRLHVLAKPATT